MVQLMERAKGFEPSTSTLARLRSTPELGPFTGIFLNNNLFVTTVSQGDIKWQHYEEEIINGKSK